MSGDMTDTMGILSENAGIIPRTLYSLFNRLEMDGLECNVKCSFIELYNEELRDLLAVDDGIKLKIYEDNAKKGHTATMVQGMEESNINTANAGIKLLQKGSYRRQVAATKCNDLSSRSHTVFTITTLMKKTSETGEDFICAGKLNLVDLAGSENIQRSGAENKRAAEAGLINKSLLTLGRVINALVDKSSHIPYRESKLTRLLQDSLGGRTKTCLIATLSPAKSNLEETISTLDYAFRAKNIRNKPQLNSMIPKDLLLKEFTAEIEKLKSELVATRQRNGVYLTTERYEEITVESESRRILADEQKARIETMEAHLRNKVQELFSVTSNFNILKKNNEVTKSALEQTEDVLEKTEIVLRATRQNLEQQTALKLALQKTEAQLQDVGKTLITNLGESVKDLDSIHSKVRRKMELHTLNKNNWQSTSSKVIDISKVVDSTVKLFQTEQSQRLAALAGRIRGFASSETECDDIVQQSLQSGVAKFEAAHDDSARQAAQSRDQMNEVLEEIKVLREEVKTKVGEGLNGLSSAAARISAEVIAELDQFHTELHTSYSSLGREFKGIFETLVQHMNSQQKEADDLRRQLQVANQKAIQASRDATKSLQAGLASEREKAKLERQTLLEKVHSLVEETAVAQEARWTANVEETTSSLDASSALYDQADAAYGQGMDEWSQKEQALVEEATKSKDVLKSKMKRDWTSINERNSKIQSSTKAVHGETVRIVDAQLQQMAVQMAALDEFVTRARSQNGEHHDNRIKNLQALSENVTRMNQDLSQHFKSASTRAQDFSTASGEAIVAAQDDLKPLASKVSGQLSTLRSEIESTPMVDYQPTGQTPQKREWDYPTTLPKTIQSPKAEASPSKRLRDTRNLALSPSKSRPASPTKLNSPSKTRVFADISENIVSGGPLQASVSQPSLNVFGELKPTNSGLAVGLRELDINTLGALAGGRPQSGSKDDSNINSSTGAADQFDNDKSIFSKSVSGAMGGATSSLPAPLRRGKSEAETIGNSKQPTKMAGSGKRGTGLVVPEGRENLSPIEQAVIAGIKAGVSGGGRRLRSSPRQ